MLTVITSRGCAELVRAEPSDPRARTPHQIHYPRVSHRMNHPTRQVANAGTNGEAELVARAAAGDETAMGELYDLYAGTLYGFGQRRLADADLAEELVQQVMTKLWRLAASYDHTRASVRTWVFMIARTAVVDLHRRREQVAVPVQIDDQADETDELDRLLRAEAVRAALDRLSPPHREVLELAYFNGRSQQEAADALGLPLGTVKSRTYYALKALRLACDELGVTP